MSEQGIKQERLLTIDDLADKMACSKRSIYRLIARSKRAFRNGSRDPQAIRFLRRGRTILFEREAVEEYLARNSVDPFSPLLTVPKKTTRRRKPLVTVANKHW